MLLAPVGILFDRQVSRSLREEHTTVQGKVALVDWAIGFDRSISSIGPISLWDNEITQRR